MTYFLYLVPLKDNQFRFLIFTSTLTTTATHIEETESLKDVNYGSGKGRDRL